MSRPAPRVRGYLIESRATNIRRVPQSDFDPPPGLGILLEIATLVPAASEAFTPEELAELVDLERLVRIRDYLRERMQRRSLVRAEGVDGTVAMIPADRIPF